MFGKKKPAAPTRRLRTPETSEQSRQERYSPVYYRNRTITGSSSSGVQAASEQSGHLQSDRTKAHALAQVRRRVALIGLLCLGVAMCVVLFMWQFVGTVRVHGLNASVQDQRRYEAVISEYFSHRPFERFRFALNTGELTRFMAAKTPEVERVARVSPTGVIESDFVLKMREPLVGWAIDGTQYFVDARGISFTQSYFGQPSVQIDDQTGVTPEAGQAIASNRFLGYVGKVIAEAKKRGYTVTEVIIPAGTTRQVEMKLKDRQFSVKLSIDRGVAMQIEDMDKAVQYFAAHGQAVSLIDVRVENRAYYR